MYVVTLSERFDNRIPNLPLYASKYKKNCLDYVNKEVEKDCKNKHAINEWFNGFWTDAEIRESFRDDYSITKVPGK